MHTKDEFLAHFITPVFYVENGSVVQVNSAAANLLITPGTQINDLLATGKEEYSQFCHGCLYLTLKLQDRLYSAAVTRDGTQDLFITEQDQLDTSLQAYSLAARELREPLAGVMMATDRLMQTMPDNSDPVARRHAAFINQNLYRMLRILGNMSDAPRFIDGTDVHMEHCNVSSILEELLTEIADTCAKSGICFSYQCPKETITAPIDQPKLERGIYNLISNAIKHTKKGELIHVAVKHRNKRLYITVHDSGAGIPQAIHDTIYKRFQRYAGIEESNQGIGLGMVLARGAASIHGGTVLIEPGSKRGAKITMTISLQAGETKLRSPVLRVDYVGERRHSLVELSDCLDAELYTSENLK